jgi:GTPase
VSIQNRNGVYVVEGEWLIPVLRSVNFDDADSLRYFERVLLKTGVDEALRAAGVHEGDTVSIYGIEFEYME